MRHESLVLWVSANDLLVGALLLCVCPMSAPNAPARAIQDGHQSRRIKVKIRSHPLRLPQWAVSRQSLLFGSRPMKPVSIGKGTRDTKRSKPPSQFATAFRRRDNRALGFRVRMRSLGFWNALCCVDQDSLKRFISSRMNSAVARLTICSQAPIETRPPRKERSDQVF